jgi:hypothetical protein
LCFFFLMFFCFFISFFSLMPMCLFFFFMFLCYFFFSCCLCFLCFCFFFLCLLCIFAFGLVTFCFYCKEVCKILKWWRKNTMPKCGKNDLAFWIGLTSMTKKMLSHIYHAKTHLWMIIMEFRIVMV